jgi:hypothetical protein
LSEPNSKRETPIHAEKVFKPRESLGSIIFAGYVPLRINQQKSCRLPEAICHSANRVKESSDLHISRVMQLHCARGNMAVFENGRFDGVTNRGWAVGEFITGPRHSTDVEIKWARLQKGPAGLEWRTCDTATTLSILVHGKIRIEFRGEHQDDVILTEPGDYVIFGPGFEHRSTALEDTLSLTIRWPSIKGDCKPVTTIQAGSEAHSL